MPAPGPSQLECVPEAAAAVIELRMAGFSEVMRAHAQQQKAFFLRRGVIVEELDGKLIVERRLGFLEGNPMLPEICRGLG